jgi:hypothetical protein
MLHKIELTLLIEIRKLLGDSSVILSGRGSIYLAQDFVYVFEVKFPSQSWLHISRPDSSWRMKEMEKKTNMLLAEQLI